MKYNKGDKIKIKSKEWFDKNKELIEFNYDVRESIEFNYGIRASVRLFLHLCDPYFGKEATITEKIIESVGYKIDIDNGRFVWPEEFFD